MRSGLFSSNSPQRACARRFGPLMRRAGGGRGGRPFSGRDINKAFRGLFQGVGTARDCWFDADNVLLVDGKTYGFIDYIDTNHYLWQPAPGQQGPAPDPSTVGGAKAVAFTAANLTYYYSSRNLFDWRFMHSLQHHIFVVFQSQGDPGGAYYATTFTGGSVSGYGLANVTSVNFSYSMLNAGALVLAAASAQGDYVPVGPTTVGETWMGESSLSPRWASRMNARVVMSGDALNGAQGTNNPPAVLNIGRRANGTAYANMRFRAVYAFHRALSSAERAIVLAKIKLDDPSVQLVAAA